MTIDWDNKPVCSICQSPKIVLGLRGVFWCERHKPKPDRELIGKYSGKSKRGIKGGYETE